MVEKLRPYWHVDAKWICGLLAVFVVSIWLILFGLFRLTDQKSAPAFINALAANLLTNPNSDVKLEATKLKQQLAPLYEKGPKAVAKTVAKDRGQEAALNKQLAAFSLFTADGHAKVGAGVLILGATGIAILFLLAFFSHRFGRLVSIGVVLLITSAPGALLFLTIQNGTETSGPKIASIGPAVLKLVAQAFLPAYLWAVAVGALLLIAALGLKIIRK